MAKNDARYTKHAIKSGAFSTEELIGEYNRLRRIKNKRLQAIGERFPRAQMTKEVSQAPPIGDLVDESGQLDMNKLSSEMQEAYKFNKRKDTTVTGYSKRIKKTIKSFNKLFPKGMNPINEENVWDLFDFLEDYRTKYNTQKILDSDRVIDVWETAYNTLNMDIGSLLKNIDYWRRHYEDMKKLKPPVDADGKPIKNVSSDWYKKQLENLDNR